MPNAAVAGGRPAGAPTAGGSIVPYFYGTNQYVEKFFSGTYTLGTTQQEIVQNINPGGFLRGVRVICRSANGVLGGGTLSGDAPFSVIASATVENIDGSPIQYPMGGWAHAWRQFFSRPWQGDPTQRFDYSATVNPSFSLFMQPEIRHTAGVLANTDARAQYRIRITLATLGQYVTGGTPTAPDVTVTFYMESWAQPDATDLRGNPIEEIPPGLSVATICRHQIVNLAAAGADNTFQLANTGNEHRLLMWVMRDSTGARANLASDPIRWRLDNRSLGVFSPDELAARTQDFYNVGGGLVAIPTGVYVWPRFFQPGSMFGEAWLTTTNATYLIWETATATGGSGGTLEIITDEVVPVGAVPMELESI